MKTILILGNGRSGQGAITLAKFFYERIVMVDEKEIPYEQQDSMVEYYVFEEGLTFDFAPDIVVISPGISPYKAFGKWAEKLNATIVSELGFALMCNTHKIPILGITGTNGKTTTTELTTHILQALGYNVEAVGNIGNAFSGAIAQSFSTPPDVFVAEISSFQLERLPSKFFPLHCAVLTNVTSDHINRYENFDDYRNVKMKIFEIAQNQSWIHLSQHPFYQGDKALRTFSASNDQCHLFLRDGTIWIRTTAHVIPLIEQRLTQLPGAHNAENMMCALALVLGFVNDAVSRLPEIRHAIQSFALGQHRVDCFATFQNQKFVDDSKGTNPDAVRVAVEHFAKGKNVRLILGGLDKGMDFSLLKPLAPMIAKAYLYGQAASQINDVLHADFVCEMILPFRECVKKAYDEMGSDDVLLLSPACASMDQFKDYAERGDVFQEMIHNCLKNK